MPPIAAAPDAAVDSIVLAHDDDRYAAMLACDFDLLERLLDDRLSYTHSVGYCESKLQYLTALRSGRVKYLRVDRELAHFAAWDRTAIMQGSLQVEAEVGGRPYRTRALFTCTWVGQGDAWKLAAWASTPEKEEA